MAGGRLGGSSSNVIVLKTITTSAIVSVTYMEPQGDTCLGRVETPTTNKYQCAE